MRATAPTIDDLVAAVDARRPADALDALTIAEGLVDELTALGDRLVGFYVERARGEGNSWAAIGERVGVSRQAAQQRYAGRWASITVADLVAAGTLERATKRFGTTLEASEGHARALGHDEIDAGHLLLALLDDERTIAGQALRECGVDAAQLRRATARVLGRGRADVAEPPVGSATRRCLSRAAVEAIAMGHNYLGTEHLLLGVAEVADDSLQRALRACGARPEPLRVAVADLLDRYLRTRE